jgi:hypothetical protein
MRPRDERGEGTEESSKEVQLVAGWIMLGQAWLSKGNSRRAAEHLRQALERAPINPSAHRHWGHLKLVEEDFQGAASHLRIAADLDSSDVLLEREARLLEEIAGVRARVADLANSSGGRIRFLERYLRDHHRSGWRLGMESLYDLHHSDGVRFEPFLDEPFAVEHPRDGVRSGPELYAALRSRKWEDRITSQERRYVPIREPWVGVLHNPFGMPKWFYPDHSPEVIFGKSVWRESMEACQGLFALSEDHARSMRRVTGKPVSVIYLPSEIPELIFDFDRFIENQTKKVVQIGWWLRRQTAIDHLPMPESNPLGYRKVRLVPRFASNAYEQIEAMRRVEFQMYGLPSPGVGEVEVLMHLPNDQYDEVLSCNIAMVQLEAASANNAVVECLARGTPLLVNRLPAVEEYLGSEYPLYYEDLGDAVKKMMDLGRLRGAHEYLVGSEVRAKLSPDYFRRTFEQSEVYQSL